MNVYDRIIDMLLESKGLGRWGAQKAARPREEQFPESTSYMYDRLVDMLIESVMPKKPKRTGGIIMNPKKEMPKKKKDYITPSTVPGTGRKSDMPGKSEKSYASKLKPGISRKSDMARKSVKQSPTRGIKFK